jgi:hypothetical protein
MWGQARGSGNGISKEVGHEIATLPFYKLFDYLTFRVDGGTVTLMGQVTKVALKSDAEKAVAHIAGVQHVNNEIEILPPSKVDEKLRLAEYSAIFGDALLTQYTSLAVPPSHIIVKNVAVTLEGTVGNDGDKTEVFTRAGSVAGVTTLTNHLTIGL